MSDLNVRGVGLRAEKIMGDASIGNQIMICTHKSVGPKSSRAAGFASTPLLTALLLLIGFLTPGSAVMAADSGWQAGFGKVKITPTQPMWMSGYASRDHGAEGTLTELWAKTICLQDARGQRVVLVTLDLVGIDRQTSLQICQAAGAKYGLERKQISLNCSHTHTGPVVGHNLGSMYFLDEAQTRLVEQYTHQLQGGILESIGQAIAALKPAQVNWGIGQATFAVNRRTNKEDEVPKLREDGLLKGPVDHTVNVLSVTGADGKLIGVVCGYACHATVLPFYQWSGDYPAFAQQALEKSHPGAVAMFVAGCGGDQNPLPRRKVELAEQYGQMLADSVEAVLLGKNQEALPAQVEAAYTEVPLPYARVPTKAELMADSMSTNKYIARRAQILLAGIEKGMTLQPTYPYPVQVWTLGPDRRMVFLGGEVVVDYALRIRKELGGNNVWPAGYSNDVMAYIPSLRVLKEGGYEGGGAMLYYGLPSLWSETVEETLIKGLHETVTRTAPAK